MLPLSFRNDDFSHVESENAAAFSSHNESDLLTQIEVRALEF